MERKTQTKFWNFTQNNSGGYFVEDETAGVCEEIIVEAQNPEEAWSLLEKIGDKVAGFWNYCSCCGERWYDYHDEDRGKDEPMHYDTPVDEVVKGDFRYGRYVHYYDGTVKRVDFKERG